MDVVNRILKKLDAHGGFRLDRFALTLQARLRQSPIGMIGPVVEGLGVRHEAEDAASGITYAGDVMDRTVGVIGESPPGCLSGRRGISQHNLLLIDKSLDDVPGREEFPLTVADGKFQTGDPAREATRGARVAQKGHPVISEISTVIEGKSDLTCFVVPVKTGKQPQVHQGLKPVTDSQDQFPFLDEPVAIAAIDQFLEKLGR